MPQHVTQRESALFIYFRNGTKQKLAQAEHKEPGQNRNSAHHERPLD
jgi:hypothetical protein